MAENREKTDVTQTFGVDLRGHIHSSCGNAASGPRHVLIEAAAAAAHADKSQTMKEDRRMKSRRIDSPTSVLFHVTATNEV